VRPLKADLSLLPMWSRRQRAPEPNIVGFGLVDSSVFNEGCRKGPNQPQISCLHSKFDVRPDRCRNIAISLVIVLGLCRDLLPGLTELRDKGHLPKSWYEEVDKRLHLLE